MVRSGLRGAAGVQKELLQGLSDVLRIDGHVRTGRCGELGVVNQHRRRLNGATAAAEQPDGFAFRRPPGRRPLPSGSFHGPGHAQVGYNENNQRALLRLWADHLEMPPVSTAITALGTAATI